MAGSCDLGQTHGVSGSEGDVNAMPSFIESPFPTKVAYAAWLSLPTVEKPAALAEAEALYAPRPVLPPPTVAVLRNDDLARHVVSFLPLSGVAVVLQLDRGFFALARERVAVMWPKLSPLLEEPFNLTHRDLVWMECLNLYKRGIGDGDLRVLSEACANELLSQLKEIKLRWNQVGDVGLSSLADACAKGSLPALEVLDLYNNCIGDAGMVSLSEALGKGSLPALKLLYLNANPFGDAGMGKLSEALGNGCMAPGACIWLCGIKATEASKQAVRDATAAIGYTVFF